jgi:chondroitin 4-sulfotransferase 11
VISHKHKYIFIHIPKTAGTSIKKYLSSFRSKEDYQSPEDPLENFGHNKLSYYEFKYKNIEDFYKFCFIRNPYDRMVSLYKYTKKWLKFNYSFLKFCQSIKIGKKYTNNIIWEDHYEPQSNYISSKINFIGRTETINDDFKKICKDINVPYKKLPQLNDSNKESIYICKECSQIIENLYESDFNFYERKDKYN